MSGQPLNTAYSSVQELLQVVRACQVHLNFHANVEFALAVHIHPYMNNVLSVWVYIASLVPIRPV
jgi:coiled-coil and C2 domain-containing protein 2A